MADVAVEQPVKPKKSVTFSCDNLVDEKEFDPDLAPLSIHNKKDFRFSLFEDYNSTSGGKPVIPNWKTQKKTTPTYHLKKKKRVENGKKTTNKNATVANDNNQKEEKIDCQFTDYKKKVEPSSSPSWAKQKLKSTGHAVMLANSLNRTSNANDDEAESKRPMLKSKDSMRLIKVARNSDELDENETESYERPKLRSKDSMRLITVPRTVNDMDENQVDERPSPKKLDSRKLTKTSRNINEMKENETGRSEQPSWTVNAKKKEFLRSSSSSSLLRACEEMGASPYASPQRSTVPKVKAGGEFAGTSPSPKRTVSAPKTKGGAGHRVTPKRTFSAPASPSAKTKVMSSSLSRALENGQASRNGSKPQWADKKSQLASPSPSSLSAGKVASNKKLAAGLQLPVWADGSSRLGSRPADDARNKNSNNKVNGFKAAADSNNNKVNRSNGNKNYKNQVKETDKSKERNSLSPPPPSSSPYPNPWMNDKQSPRKKNGSKPKRRSGNQQNNKSSKANNKHHYTVSAKPKDTVEDIVNMAGRGKFVRAVEKLASPHNERASLKRKTAGQLGAFLEKKEIIVDSDVDDATTDSEMSALSDECEYIYVKVQLLDGGDDNDEEKEILNIDIVDPPPKKSLDSSLNDSHDSAHKTPRSGSDLWKSARGMLKRVREMGDQPTTNEKKESPSRASSSLLSPLLPPATDDEENILGDVETNNASEIDNVNLECTEGESGATVATTEEALEGTTAEGATEEVATKGAEEEAAAVEEEEETSKDTTAVSSIEPKRETAEFLKSVDELVSELVTKLVTEPVAAAAAKAAEGEKIGSANAAKEATEEATVEETVEEAPKTSGEGVKGSIVAEAEAPEVVASDAAVAGTKMTKAATEATEAEAVTVVDERPDLATEAVARAAEEERAVEERGQEAGTGAVAESAMESDAATTANALKAEIEAEVAHSDMSSKVAIKGMATDETKEALAIDEAKEALMAEQEEKEKREIEETRRYLALKKTEPEAMSEAMSETITDELSETSSEVNSGSSSDESSISSSDVSSDESSVVSSVVSSDESSDESSVESTPGGVADLKSEMTSEEAPVSTIRASTVLQQWQSDLVL